MTIVVSDDLCSPCLDEGNLSSIFVISLSGTVVAKVCAICDGEPTDSEGATE